MCSMVVKKKQMVKAQWSKFILVYRRYGPQDSIRQLSVTPTKLSQMSGRHFPALIHEENKNKLERFG